MERLLEFDPASFRKHFAKDPFEIRHRLHDHPLFSLEAVAELADNMPKHYTGRIAASASRVMLWEVEQVPAYRELIDACLDELQACVQDTCGPLGERMVRAF